VSLILESVFSIYVSLAAKNQISSLWRTMKPQFAHGLIMSVLPKTQRTNASSRNNEKNFAYMSRNLEDREVLGDAIDSRDASTLSIIVLMRLIVRSCRRTDGYGMEKLSFCKTKVDGRETRTGAGPKQILTHGGSGEKVQIKQVSASAVEPLART
jgi:hypothetical protein